MLVRVYRNLHTGTLSMQTKINGRWKVIGHPRSVSLTNVKFIVSKAGRERTLREKQKCVHAFVQGTLEFSNHGDLMLDGAEVGYNPYKMDSFYLKQNMQPVYQAKFMEIHASKFGAVIRGEL